MVKVANECIKRAYVTTAKDDPASIDLDSLKIDEVIDKIVNPIGAWQYWIVILTSFSIPCSVFLAVFFNSSPEHRCRVEAPLENLFQNISSPINDMNLNLYLGIKSSTNYTVAEYFNTITKYIGPWNYSNSKIYSYENIGCYKYSIDSKKDASVVQLLDLYQKANIGNYSSEKCNLGYVYFYKDYQYKGGIVEEWDLVCDSAWKVPFSESAVMVGMVIGFLIGGWITDLFGRRKAIIFAGYLECLANVCISFSPNYTCFVILRTLVALGMTARTTAFTVLIAEITVARYRSILFSVGAIIQLCIHRLLLALLAYYIYDWRLLNGITVLPNCLVIFSYFYLPESPKWLSARLKYKEAADILYCGYYVNTRVKQMFCFENDIVLLEKDAFMRDIGMQQPFIQSKKDIDQSECENDIVIFYDKSNKGYATSSLNFYKNKDIIVTTVLSIFLLSGQMTCTFGLIFYVNNIREHVSYAIAFTAISSSVGTILTGFLYRHFVYRKKPLVTMYVITIIILVIASLHTLIFQPQTDTLLNIFMNFGYLFMSSAFRMLLIYIPELYSPLQRTRGLGVASGIGRLGGLSFPVINRLDKTVKHGFPMVVYASIILLQIAILLFLQDTSGESVPSPVLLNSERKIHEGDQNEQ